jgi:4-hydroxy-tetrahydrodipicolinate synthase
MAFISTIFGGSPFSYEGQRCKSARGTVLHPPLRCTVARTEDKAELKVVERAQPFFGRVVTALVTPFKLTGTEVDYSVAESLAAHLAENGSDAIIVAGTTGESTTLTWSEEYELFRVVKSAVSGTKCRVIAGAGSNSTEEAIEATKKSAKLGLDGTLQVVPYYNKPPQQGLMAHFRAIANAEPDLPMMLYNIPGRTGINMAAETSIKLVEMCPNIVALKEASGNLEQFAQIRRGTPPTFALYSGDDALTLPLLALGGSGVVSVASHFIGPEIQRMIQLFLDEGNPQEALRIHFRYMDFFNALFVMANPIPAKAALRLLGWPVGPTRLPLTEITATAEQQLRRAMTEAGLLSNGAG